MGQFKPMVKMMTTEPTVELKLKKGGSVKKAMGGMMGAPMDASMASSMPSRGGMMPVATPKRPTMAARRAAMLGMKGMQGGMKEGGESKSTHKAEMSKMKGLEKELKSHEGKPASKGHKGLATGGVAKGNAGGYKDGGMAMVEKGGKMVPDFAADGKGKMKHGGKAMATGGVVNGQGGYATGGVAMSNAGGYKKGGATKKAYATGGTVDTGKPVAMPQGDKKPSTPVSTNRVSGTFKKGGKVMMSEGGTTDASKGAYDKSIGPSESDMDMAKAIRSVPRKLYEGAKSLFTNKDKPSGSVTKTEKSVTVTPARKRGGAVNC